MTDPTDSQDEFFRRLTAADPVDQNALPSPQSPSAQQLLEQAINHSPSNHSTINHENASHEMNQQSNPHPPNSYPPNLQPAGAGRQVTDPVDPSEFQFDHSTPAPGRTRGRGMLVAAAAAVLLLVGGVLVLAPDNTSPAVATVHSAAASTLEASTARITTVFSLEGQDGTDSGSVSGQFDAEYADDDVSFTVDLSTVEFDGPQGVPDPTDLPVSEARIVDGVIYINFGERWLAVETDGLLGSVVNQFADPRQVLETVQELTETTEVGPATVDGVATTHFQSVIDLGDEQLSSSGWLAFEGMPVESDGEVTVDLFVDDSGVLRQLDLSGDIQDTSGSGESGTFNVETRFYDIGADIVVEAPPASQTLEGLDGFLSE